MNLYRGCTHGCIYCDSRSVCYQFDHDFEDIEVKENAIELLEDALKRKREKCMIGTGSMTDPYMPIENTIRSTRRALEVIERHGFGVTLITKSASVLQDMDLFKRIHQKSKVVIQMTLTTMNDRLTKLLEPNVSSTQERIAALNQFRDEGIPTVVWMTPILPFINDTRENIEAIVEACAKAKVVGIICFAMGLTLREGNREYYYHHLEKSFPGLKEKYEKTYGNAYVLNSPQHLSLMKFFHEKCHQHGIVSDLDEIFTYLKTYEDKQQMCLF